MGKKGGNSKAEAAKDRKAQAQAEKKSKKEMENESKLQQEWSAGAKDTSKRDLLEHKKREEERRREEKRQLERQEEAEMAKLGKPKMARKLNEYSASGINDALDLLKLTSNQKIELDRHPERRLKAAYQAFEDAELPRLKQENPGLRLSQLKEQVQKLWKKSPLNPMNQAHVAFNASQDEVKQAESALRNKQLAEFEN